MKRKITILTILIGIGIIVSGAYKMNSKTENTDTFNLGKYMGTWYEIARFDHRFERNLQNVTATYKLMPNGKVQVINKGNDQTVNGPQKTAIGKAKVKSLEKRHLRVSFFWIFYSDYKILELDPDYKYALIGSKSPNYFWILSRTPQLSDSIRTQLIQKAELLGYDTQKLIWVEHQKTD
jgi:apolipoprotein D and lipocalin family protein